MATYYAWAPITISDSTKQKPFTTIQCGEKVTKTQVGVDWNDLLSSGSIRTKPYPKDIRSDESPHNAELRKLNEAVAKVLQPYNAEDNPDLDDDVEVEAETANG